MTDIAKAGYHMLSTRIGDSPESKEELAEAFKRVNALLERK